MNGVVMLVAVLVTLVALKQIIDRDWMGLLLTETNSRRKPPNSFGWRNAANLSLPIYLLSPMKGVCLSAPCAKVLP